MLLATAGNGTPFTIVDDCFEKFWFDLIPKYTRQKSNLYFSRPVLNQLITILLK